MTESASIILLYCLATLIAIVTRRLRVPYTAALLVAGVLLGAVHVVPLPHLTKDLLFTVFLPGLIFEAAYGLGVSELRTSAATIGVLAVPGVVLTPTGHVSLPAWTAASIARWNASSCC